MFNFYLLSGHFSDSTLVKSTVKLNDPNNQVNCVTLEGTEIKYGDAGKVNVERFEKTVGLSPCRTVNKPPIDISRDVLQDCRA
jgi:hypothetical protein